MEYTHPAPGSSVRAALNALREHTESFVEIDRCLDPFLEIAAHYRDQFAACPASSRSGDEPVVLYRASGFEMPVLMGLFGSRRRNEWLLGAEPGEGSRRLAHRLASPVAPVWRARPPCRECAPPAALAALPVLTTTALDAGPYVTSGVVCAGDPDGNFVNVSIHRMRVLDSRHMTIWMLPGRDLDVLYQAAVNAKRPLPVSINIGAPPAVSITSSLSTPFVRAGSGEIEAAGSVLGAPVEIARCVMNNSFCFAQSEIVVEGNILPETTAEYSDPIARLAMPEFLGYMGRAQALAPVVEVCGVFHRRDAVYQTVLGPGKEQSELLALPVEAGMLLQLNEAMAGDPEILDVHCLAAGGGQLVVALRVRKHHDNRQSMKRLLDAITTRHGLAKAVWVVDEDVDIHSPEDLLWAAATRFQPGVDMHVRTAQPGFPLDPSQAAGYLATTAPITDKYLMDLTAPLALRSRFNRH